MGLPLVDFESWIGERIMEYESWVFDCRLWLVECGLWIVNCRLLIMDCEFLILGRDKYKEILFWHGWRLSRSPPLSQEMLFFCLFCLFVFSWQLKEYKYKEILFWHGCRLSRSPPLPQEMSFCLFCLFVFLSFQGS